MDINDFSTGIDIIEIDRIAKAIDRYGDRFLNKVFTRTEVKYCRSKPRSAQHFAARFAAKEAVFKAIGGTENLWFNQIEILNHPSGQPQVRFIDSEHFKGEDFRISISHSKDFAAAVAITVSSNQG